MLDLSTAATLVKNSLVDTGSWVIMLTLTSPDLSSIIRICSNTEDISFNGETFSAFPFELDDINEAVSGELPTLSLKVSNINRLVQSYIEQDPTLGSDWEVYLQVKHTSNTQNYLTYSQDYTQSNWVLTDATIYTEKVDEFIGPFGIASATELIADGIGTDASLTQSYDFTGTSIFNFSTHVKQNQGDLQFNIEIADQGTTLPIYSVNLDFTAGVLTFLGTEAGVGTISIDTTPFGWYRINLAVTGVSSSLVDFITRPSLKGVVTSNRLLIDATQVADDYIKYTPTDSLPLTDGLLSESELDAKFISLSVGADKEWVTFQIGMPNPLRMQVPRTKYNPSHCQHTYMQGGCPYTGALTECAKDLGACSLHFPNADFLPILAFPGIAAVAIYE